MGCYPVLVHPKRAKPSREQLFSQLTHEPRGMRLVDIARQLHRPARAVHEALTELLAEGAVRLVGGKYQIAPKEK